MTVTTNSNIAGGGSINSSQSTGAGNPVATPYTSAIPLDLPNGRDLGVHMVTTNEVFTIGVGGVDNGTCVVTLLGDGVHTPNFSAFINPNSFTFDNTKVNEMAFLYRNGQGYAYDSVGILVDSTPPTLVSATVQNATPTHVDLVWSEPMNSDISAAAAWAITGGAGYTVSSHSFVDSTHTTLNLASSVAGGDVITLAYTTPVSSKMRDVAGNLLANFSGTSITNNVALSPVLTITHTVDPALPIDVTGKSSYNFHDGSFPNVATTRGKKGTDIGDPAAYGVGSDNNSQSLFGTIQWTDATSGDASPSGDIQSTARTRIQTNAGSEAGIQWVCLADTNLRTYRFFGRMFGGSGGMSYRATLGDASAGPTTDSYNSTSHNFYFEIQVRASSVTTVTIQVFNTGSGAASQYSYCGGYEV